MATVIAADSRQHVILSSERIASQLHVYSPSGNSRILSRSDSAPPFSFIRGVFVDGGDSVHVFDYSLRRRYVLSPHTLSLIRTHPLHHFPQSALPLPDGRLVVALSVRTPSAAAYPLHIVGAKGVIEHSFGHEVSGGPLHSERIFRSLSLAGPDAFIAAHRLRYRLEVWNSKRTLLRALDLGDAGFEPSFVGPLVSRERPAPRQIVSIASVGLDTLQVFGVITSANYAAGVTESVSHGRSVVGIRDINTYYDGWLDFVDVKGGQVIASHRFDAPLVGIGNGLAFSYRYRNGTFDGITVWRVWMSQPSP